MARPKVRTRRPFASRCSLTVMALLALAPSVWAREVHYGVLRDGSTVVVNSAADNFLQSAVAEWEGPEFTTISGGYRIGSDSFLIGRVNPTGDQDGWAIYRMLEEERQYQKVASLPGALSATVFRNGTLYGITYRPARLVEVNPSNGAFKDLGIFEVEQTSPFVDRASLAFDETGRLFYLHRNITEDMQLWEIDLSAKSWRNLPFTIKIRESLATSLFYLGDGWFGSQSGIKMYTYKVEGTAVIDTGERYIGRRSYLGGAWHRFKAFVPADLTCEPTDLVLCLHRGQFRVELSWDDPFEPQAGAKPARLLQLAADSGAGWFTAADNLEVLVKVLATCTFADYWWVFGAASTDLSYRLTVTDTRTGAQRVYTNQAGQRSPAITDNTAFPCLEALS